MRTLTTLFLMTALTFSIGCSGGDDDDGGNGPTADASTNPDGMATGPDAMQGSGAEGQACAASEADPTGGCPTDYACLGLGGGATTCFKTCPTANAAECTGYDGPGTSVCIVTIQDEQMNPIGAACGTVCGDTTGMVPGCTGGACDGTCPGTWSCVDNLDMMGNPTGVKVCQ